LAINNVAIDILSADEPLDGYKLVIAPALNILDQKQISNLTSFVQGGGHLVLTIRSGMKDEHNALLPSRQPGPLVQLTGVEVEDYYTLEEPIPVEGKWLNGSSKQWAERLKLVDTQNAIPISSYGKSNGWLDGQIAMVAHPYGKGMVYTSGAYLDEQAQQTFIDHVLQMAGIRGIKTEIDVEASMRIDPSGKVILIVINHTATKRSFTLPWPAMEHLTGQAVENQLSLLPYAVAILTQAA